MNTVPRGEVEAAIAADQTEARHSRRTQYVGAIGFPDGSTIYPEYTLGFTHDRALLANLGNLWATVTAETIERHA